MNAEKSCSSIERYYTEWFIIKREGKRGVPNVPAMMLARKRRAVISGFIVAGWMMMRCGRF